MAELIDGIRHVLKRREAAELEALPGASDWADFRRRCGRIQAFREAHDLVVDEVRKYLDHDDDDEEE